MSEELVSIEVDGREVKARPGSMLIEATDAAGINVPRFCYHKKLSIAANCRMCLVEVERAPKPLPACATPVAAGMKVFTKSARALAAQKGTMEFLLINHPLDCPICDQGGECELQDVSLGYGDSNSRFTEGKRVVADKDIGPLIETEMTRCIHCTRCVRFGEEIAGLRELGMTGRGEDVRIGTYIAKSVDSEMSGNVIDLCPVGALTAKPSRYTARAWEMIQHASIAPHDCIGSNLYMHTRDGKVMRVVPRENEEINEVWLADRDRFSYQGIYAKDRITVPMIKKQGEWHEVEWTEALAAASETLVNASNGSFGALVSATATLEEQYLLQKLVRALGSNNIDHRLRQIDFTDQQAAPIMPWLGTGINELENQDQVLLVGSNVRKEQPIAANRLRKAAMAGAGISFINARRYPLHFDAEQLVAGPMGLVAELAAVTAAVLTATKKKPNATIKPLLEKIKPSKEQQQIAKSFLSGERKLVLLGSLAVSHPHYSSLRALSAAISAAAESSFGYLPEASNTAGAWLSGCVPHRSVAGSSVSADGLNSAEIFAQCKNILLYGVEPEFDSYDPKLTQTQLEAADNVVAISAYASEHLKRYATVILPVGLAAEISGTLVNAEGRWQNFRAAANLLGNARPGWKVLRVLANLAVREGFEYNTVEEVRAEIQSECKAVVLDNRITTDCTLQKLTANNGMFRFGEASIYAGDAQQRRSSSLQQTKDALQFGAHMAAEQAKKLKLDAQDSVGMMQEDEEVALRVFINDDVPVGSVWIPVARPGDELLGALYGSVELRKL